MNLGKSIRISRIVGSDGKTIIVPIDHAIEGYYQELEDPEWLINEFVKGGANAVLLRRGMLARVWRLVAGRLGVVYRLNGATGTSPDVTDERVISGVEDALLKGADAVVYTIIVGHPKENDMLADFGEISDAAYSMGMPLIGEVDTWPSSPTDKAELLRQGVRTLSEEGADLIKTYFPEDVSYYTKIIRNSLVPVVAAGGPKMNSVKDVLVFAENIMKAGAIGVCFGRNVWQSRSPSSTLLALSAIVREGKSAEEASRIADRS